MALHLGSFSDVGSATPEERKFKRSRAAHTRSVSRRGQGSAPGIPPTPLCLAESSRNSPRPGVRAAPPRGRGESEPRKGCAGGTKPPCAWRERERELERRPPGAATPRGGGAGRGSPGVGGGRARAPPLLLLRCGPRRPPAQRRRAEGVAPAAGARVLPPPAPARRLRRGRQQLQAPPQRPPPRHPGGELNPWAEAKFVPRGLLTQSL